MPEDKEMRALPAPATAATANGHVPAIPDPITVYPPTPTPSPSLRKQRYRSPLSVDTQAPQVEILGFALVSVIATVVVSSRLTPIYESTATIDVDRQAPAALIGQDAAAPARTTRPVPGHPGQDHPVRFGAAPVAERFKLTSDITSLPGDPAPSARAQNAPVTLRSSRSRARPNKLPLLISFRSPDPELASDVANGIADSYIQHTYDIRFRATAGLSAYMEKQIEELRAKMERSSAALGAIRKRSQRHQPEEKTSILSSRLLPANTEYTTARATASASSAAYIPSKAVHGGRPSLHPGRATPPARGPPRRSREKFATTAAQYGAGHPEYKKAPLASRRAGAPT